MSDIHVDTHHLKSFSVLLSTRALTPAVTSSRVSTIHQHHYDVDNFCFFYSVFLPNRVFFQWFLFLNRFFFLSSVFFSQPDVFSFSEHCVCFLSTGFFGFSVVCVFFLMECVFSQWGVSFS